MIEDKLLMRIDISYKEKLKFNVKLKLYNIKGQLLMINYESWMIHYKL